MPNSAEPSSLGAVSSLGVHLPTRVYWSGVLIAGSAARLMLAASAQRAPNCRLRPEAAWVTCPPEQPQASAATPQRRDAAATSRARALAPACCIMPTEVRTPALPTVIWPP